jgi:hypothetical protein
MPILNSRRVDGKNEPNSEHELELGKNRNKNKTIKTKQ